MACHKLTLVNTEAGRHLKLKSGSMQINTKFRRNLLESILPRTVGRRIEVFTKNGKLVLNLNFTCIQTIYMLSILN